MQKLYSRINWENEPSIETPLNEQNLNRMDAALDNVDNRVISQDTTKADKTELNNLVMNWVIDEETGIITITKKSGEKILFDLNIEKIPVGFSLSSNGILTMTTDDGTKFTANIGAMIPVLTFNNSDTIAVSLSGTGINKTYSFSVKNGSVTEEKLQPNFLSAIKVEVAKAEASVGEAEGFAKQSQSYAIGTGNVRPSEATDNAKSYYEKSKEIYNSLEDSGNVTGVKGNNETSYRSGKVNLTPENIGALSNDGGKITGDLVIEKSKNDVLVKAKRTDTGVQIRFGVGIDGIAHGLWSDPHNKWMIYADSSGIYLNGTASKANGINGILPVANGGTGKSTGQEAITSLLDSLAAGSAAPVDTDTYLASGVGSTIGNYCRRPLSYLWSYIKSKWDADYKSKTYLSRGNFTSNIDTLHTAGCYWLPAGQYSGTVPSGYAISNTFWYLIIDSTSGQESCIQRIIPYVGNGSMGIVYERMKINNVWSAWRKIASGDFLPLSGGIITGDVEVDGKITSGTSSASGKKATALGESCSASGNVSFAAGGESSAMGIGTIVIGIGCIAHGNYGQAMGYYTEASYFQHVIGSKNKLSNGPASQGAKSGDAFIIGNGTDSVRSNAFRVTGSGETYACSAFNSSGADYAEFFEWEDGNTENEDRRGYFVTLSGDKIKLAKPGDYILGVVSANPTVIGNSDEGWTGRYITDQFGSYIEEAYEYDEVSVDENGKETTTRKTGITWKENPDYDPEMTYIQRADRAEWDAVGMMGVLPVRDDGSCEVNGYCTVADGGIATACSRSVTADVYRVIARSGNNVIRVVVK